MSFPKDTGTMCEPVVGLDNPQLTCKIVTDINYSTH
jgi:hypothetical protein